MDDMLNEVAYGTCRDKDVWRYLAECFETIGKDWAQIRALRTYRRIGDHEDYLRLRRLNMKYGGDFHDLATFYWERGEKQRAIQVAKEGAPGVGSLCSSHKARQFQATCISGGNGPSGAGLERPRIGRQGSTEIDQKPLPSG